MNTHPCTHSGRQSVPNLVEIQNTKVYKNTSKIPSYFIRWYTFVVFIYYITMK